MTPTLIGVLVVLASAFVALTLVRLFGARRQMVGFGWILAGVGLCATGGLLRLWVLAFAGAGCLAFGFWLRRRARLSQKATQRSPTPEQFAAAQLLNVAPDAPRAVVAAAFRKAMAHAHPDAGGSDAQVRALVQARDTLLQRSVK